MWYYKGSEISCIEDMPEDTFGFIYIIEHIPSGMKYIGKKVLYFNRTLPPLKGYKRKRKTIKESDWKTYYGSQKEIKNLLKEGKESEFKREILKFVKTKKLLTYYETKYLFINEVLEDNSLFLNDNILGKFYRNDFYD